MFPLLVADKELSSSVLGSLSLLDSDRFGFHWMFEIWECVGGGWGGGLE